MDSKEATTMEAQAVNRTAYGMRRAARVIGIAALSAIALFMLGSAAATYYIAKEPELLIRMIAEQTGYHVTLEKIEVSFQAKGPALKLSNISAEGGNFTGERKITVAQAYIALSPWSILTGKGALISELELQGIRADVTEIITAGTNTQTTPWDPAVVLDLLGVVPPNDDRSIFGQVELRDAVIVYGANSEAFDLTVPEFNASLSSDQIEMSAVLETAEDHGRLRVTGKIARSVQGHLTAQGVVSAEDTWIPLPFLEAGSALHQHKHLVEHQGVLGSVVRKATIPYQITFTHEELAIASDAFVITSDSFSAHGVTSFNIIRSELEPQFKIDVTLTDADASFGLAVLPAALLGHDVTKLIQEIVSEATASEARLFISYPEVAEDDPPADALILTAQAKSSSVPLPQWPSVTNVTADIDLTMEGLAIAVHAAEFAGLPVNDASVNIPSFGQASRLTVHVPVAAKIEQIKAMLMKTPLASDVAVFDRCSASGFARGSFEGDFEFEQGIFKVSSESLVSDTTVSCEGFPLKMTAASARVYFDNDKVHVSHGNGRFGSDSIAFDVVHDMKKTLTMAKANGTFSADLLRTLDIEQPTWVSGKTTYEVTGSLQDSKYEVSLSSPTAGLDIHIPGLAKKAASETRRLDISAHGSVAETNTLQIKWDRILYGDISYVTKEKDQFNRFGGYIAGQPVAGPVNPGAVFIDLTNIKGRAEYSAANASWDLRFSKIDLSEFLQTKAEDAAASDVTASKESKAGVSIDPRSIPSFHFLCEDFRFGENRGQIEVDAQNVADGLEFQQLDINMGVISVYNGSGSWKLSANGVQTSSVAGQVKVRDGGRLLKELGFSSDITGIKGDAQFNASWPGAPYAVSQSTIVGEASGQLDSIVIKKSRGDLLRIIDLVTLNVINVVGSDLNIERIAGTIRYSKGIATTEDATVDLPSANLALAGSANTLDKTVDSRVTMKLKVTRIINAIGLAIANPFLGLGYIGYEKSSHGNNSGYLDRLTQHTYKVVGAWDDPKIQAEGFRFLPGI